MLQNRLIPCLLIDNERLVKTTKFSNPSYIGDPINSIRIFNDKEVDEIIILDIGASKNGKAPNFHFIEKLASECFMPLCYGGGIQNIEHVKKLVSLGVEKVSLNTAILDNYDLIAEISKLYGSQNVVASVDINRSLLGGYFNYKAKNSNLFQHFKNIVDSGAGEILINCVHKDGTLSGPDFKLLKNLINEIKIPITYVGGVSSIIDIEKAFEFGVSAIGAGSFFIYYGKHKAVLISYPKLNFINGIKTSM